MNYPKQTDLNASTCQERYIKAHYPEFYEHLLIIYPDLSHPERLYWFYNDIKERPKCHCGKETKFDTFKTGYRKYCSSKCIGTDPYIIECKKQTSLNHFGTEFPTQHESIRNKCKQTCLEKYGVDNVAKMDDFNERCIRTNRKKYGHDHPLQNIHIKEKLINTQRSKNIKEDDNLIGYDNNGNQIRKCPHSNCNKCMDKKFVIPTNIYFDRKRLGCELCTNLLKIGARHDSTFEQYIMNILNRNNIEYIRNDRTILSPKELDFYIPSKQLAIECNGIWAHSTINNLDPKYPSYHINKTQDCKNHGIDLFHIWEDWYIYKRNILESMILNKLGLIKHKIYARKCIIKEIDSKICNIFLNENHIQGEVKSNIRIGLYYNNELVSVMCFIKNSNMNKRKYEEWNLNRFCTKINTNVIGAASKLFKYFIKKYNPESITSYSMNDFSNGNLYKILGFKQTGFNKVYWYFEPKTLKRYHRSSFTKNTILKYGWRDKKDNTWTELDVMKEYGYFQIYDSGQTKYSWYKIS